MAVLDAIYTSVAGSIDGLVTGKYSAVAGLVSTPLQVGMGINLVVCGYAIMRGLTNEPWGSYLTTWFKAYLVVLAATSNFGPWAASAAQQLPDQLVSVLGGDAIGGQFDAFVQSTTQAAQAVSDGAEPWNFDAGPVLGTIAIPDLFAIFLYFLIYIAAYLVAGIALVLALFVKFGLAVTIAVGPIFVGLLMFNSTSGLFFGWLGAIINYALQSAALALVFVFVSGSIWSFISTTQSSGAGAPAVYGALLLQLVLVIIGGALIFQAPSVASAIAGSGGASGSPLVAAVIPSSRTVRAATRGGIRAGGAVASRSGRAVGGAARRAIAQVGPGIRRLRGASTAAGEVKA